jgi:protein-tyrosine-phosphatase
MAEGLLKARLKDEPEIWRIESAGVWAQKGWPAAGNTLDIVQRHGVDIRTHRSRPISQQLVQEFNLILTMEHGQKEALRAAFPQHAHKVFLFSEIAGENHEIVDPVGGSYYDYEITANEINDLFERGLLRLRQLAAAESSTTPDGYLPSQPA